jgi:hypothetical protein
MLMDQLKFPSNRSFGCHRVAICVKVLRIKAKAHWIEDEMTGD